jgi:hypothetical protein
MPYISFRLTISSEAKENRVRVDPITPSALSQSLWILNGWESARGLRLIRDDPF